MARFSASLALFLFLFTFSYARDIHDPFPRSESEPETTHSKHDTVSFTLPSTSTLSTHPVPLTALSFRPINRHVAGRPLPLSFRLGRHRCRHSHPLEPRRLEIPYGNDMILPSDVVEGRGGFDPANRGVVRQIPARWTRLRHGEPRFSEIKAHPLSHHRHSHREHEKGKGGLLKRIRMFLNLF